MPVREADLKLNTAIAALMELVNELTSREPADAPQRAVVREALEAIATLLAPLAPHLAEELWHEVRGRAADGALLATQPWPAHDPALIEEEVVTVAVQVNGRLRGEVRVPRTAHESEVRAAAEGEARVRAHLSGRPLRRIVYAEGRVINFVVG